MLTSAHLTTILPALDLERACRFYGETLGLRERRRTADDGALFSTADGSDVELLRRNQRTRAEHTALTFEVDDVEREIRELEGRGVRFEDYDLPGLKTERHMATIGFDKAAWFKDTEGNILCLHQPGPSKE
jgi:catechol 2,3-dioxygenase-like lactoylglutathione lyase family enzyme